MPPRRHAVLTLAFALLSFGVIGQDRLPSTRSLVDRAAAYVAAYQEQLTAIVADEEYTQTIEIQQPRDPQMPRMRRMRSEVFFMFAPASRDWMAIRDVMSVDGEAVRDRPDLRHALETLPARSVAATFKEYNSRYNVGRTFRNFNEPTLGLLVLDTEHRGRFSFDVDRRRVDRSGDTAIVTVTYTERERPPLIMDPRRGPAFAKGDVTIEADTGRIRLTRLTAKVGELRLELTTEYSPDARLGMLVPTAFRERYAYGADFTPQRLDSGREYESIVCEARYSNFRRFETSVRIR